MASEAPFKERLKLWRTDLLQKERALLLGVELETFRGWLYKDYEPWPYVQKMLFEKMEIHTKPK